MSDILTQNEIDSLFESIENDGLEAVIEAAADSELNGEFAKYDIREYNFLRPPKFNKEHLKTLEVIYDNYARTLSSFLTGYLRTPVNLDVSSVEQVTYNEFNKLLPNPVLISIVNLSPLKGSIIIEMSAQIGYAVIDRILGGPGVTMKQLRDFSEIEKMLIKRVFTQMTNALVEPWENVQIIKPRVEKIETNPQFAQIISPNEMVAHVDLKVKVGDAEGMINFCIPYLVVEPVMNKLNMRHWYTSKQNEDTSQYKEAIEHRLEITKLPVKAIIGKTTIYVSDFVELQVGDVIPLDSFINSDLVIEIGNLHKFNAKPGISRMKNSVQITEVIRKEED
ncbi:MAG: flagellar motor switch protein FliM [Lachnospirales bacterium]